MKPTPTTSLPDLYATWMSTGLSMILGNAPPDLTKEPIAKPAPKLARRSPVRRAAPAKKRSASRKAKGAKRR